MTTKKKSTRGQLARKVDRRVVVSFSDTHCGHVLGIAAPGTLLQKHDEKGALYEEEHIQTPPQKYLWNLLRKGKDEVKYLAGSDKVHLFFGGDPVNGDAKGWDGNFTNSETNQTAVATDVIDDWVREKWIASVRLASSTARHVFNDKSADYSILRELRRRNKGKDMRLVRHGKSNVGGAIVDFAHHGPLGESIRDWLDGRQMRYYLDDLFYKSLRYETDLPTIVLRGHVHTRSEEWAIKFMGDKRLKMLGCTLPSMQLLTDYAEKVTRSEEWVTNGVLAIEVIEGQPNEAFWFTETRDISVREEL